MLWELFSKYPTITQFYSTNLKIITYPTFPLGPKAKGFLFKGIYLYHMNPEFERIIRQSGVNSNQLNRPQQRSLPISSRPQQQSEPQSRFHRKFSNKKLMGHQPTIPSPLHVGPLEEGESPGGRIIALQSRGVDDGLKLIYDWTRTQKIDYKEFEDLMAEFTSKILKQIR